jgi:hypothetical protein
MRQLALDRASRASGDELVVPGLAASADAQPARSSAWDEEFDGGRGAWKVLQGSGHSFNGTAPSHLVMQSASSAYRTGVPAAPFTVTARCSDVAFDNIVTTNGNATLGLGEVDPSTGGMFGLELDVANLGNTSLYGARWSALAYLGNIGTLFEYPGHAMAYPHFQRLVVNSSTSVDGYFSFDGIRWIQELSAYNPGFTIGSIVLLSYACKTAWDWVRFTQP